MFGGVITERDYHVKMPVAESVEGFGNLAGNVHAQLRHDGHRQGMNTFCRRHAGGEGLPGLAQKVIDQALSHLAAG